MTIPNMQAPNSVPLIRFPADGKVLRIGTPNNDTKNTERGLLLFIVRHAAEHLGQSIVYARVIGVVPPWTEDARKAQAASPKKQ